MEGRVECDCRCWYVFGRVIWLAGLSADFATAGPAHAVYFGTYEIVKDMAGGNVDEGHHPLAAGGFAILGRMD